MSDFRTQHRRKGWIWWWWIQLRNVYRSPAILILTVLEGMSSIIVDEVTRRRESDRETATREKWKKVLYLDNVVGKNVPGVQVIEDAGWPRQTSEQLIVPHFATSICDERSSNNELCCHLTCSNHNMYNWSLIEDTFIVNLHVVL